MNKTSISYLDYTWNPLKMTCTPISGGCKNCWHLNYGKRFGKVYETPVLNEKELLAPLALKTPSRIGVQFMGDLFHESVPMSMICNVFATTQYADWHTYIFLTKRSERLSDWSQIIEYLSDSFCMPKYTHLWMGVSVEDQKTWILRMHQLLEINHPNLFISVEPLLGEINFYTPLGNYLKKPSWFVVGGESGPNHRPCKIEWIEKIVSQCREWKIPCYIKQDSGPRPGMQGRIPDELWKIKEMPFKEIA